MSRAVPPELADAEGTVGFTAVLDDNGRLAQLSITIPDAPPGFSDTVEFYYFDHGMRFDISPPPDEEVSPMPEELLPLVPISG